MSRPFERGLPQRALRGSCVPADRPETSPPRPPLRSSYCGLREARAPPPPVAAALRRPFGHCRTLPDIAGHVSAGPRERVGPREREHRAERHVLVGEADPGLLLPRLPVAVIATNSEGKQFAPEPESLVRASTRPRKANPLPLRRNSRQNQAEHAAFCGTLRRNQGVARSSPKRCVNS